MADKLGLEVKTYRNTGTTGTPVWNEVTNIKDESFEISKATADTTTRGAAGWRTTRGTLKEGTVSFQMIYDTAQDDYVAFRDAFVNNTRIDCALADGAIATSGTQYFRALFDVLKFSITRNLEDAVVVDVEMAPSYDATLAPGFTTVA